MKYIGSFMSIAGKAYRIEFTTEKLGQNQTLVLGGSPFCSSVSGGDKHLYTPIRCGGATVQIVSENYIFDLYAGQAKAVGVKLIEETADGDKIRWTGYVSPTAYDQGYDSNLETISIDCVDGVAVLKDIPFRSDEKAISTFANIVFHCLRESGCFSAFYVSDNVQLKAGAQDAILEKLRVSTSNFFDERKDMKQTDDDLAWSCYDVLYQLLQWLGYTLVVEGDEVIILDYDALTSDHKAGRKSYYHKYDLNGDTCPSGLIGTMGYSHEIKGSSYAASGTKLSLDEVFNKVTVKDEFNTYDDLFPAFGDANFEENITSGGDQVYASGLLARMPAYPERNLDGPTWFRISFPWGMDFSGVTPQIDIFRFHSSPVFYFMRYNRGALLSGGNGTQPTGNEDLMNYNGAFYLRHYQAEIKTGLTGFAPTTDKATLYTGIEKIMSYMPSLTSVTLKPLIVMINAKDGHIGPGDGANLNDETDNEMIKQTPFVTLREGMSSAIFGGANHILRIKGTFRYHNKESFPFPLLWPSETKKKEADWVPYNQDRKYGSQGFIWCKVKWGTQWWNGKDWQSSDTWFKLWFWDEAEVGETWKNWNHYNKDFDFVPNPAFPAEDGYVIPCPPDGSNLTGTPEVCFTPRDMFGCSRHKKWNPKGDMDDNYYCRNYATVSLISNLEITAEVMPGLFADADLDSDTCYTNVIDNGSVTPMREVSFKVCTDDGKRPSYSSVDYLDGAQSKFVTSTYNKALQSAEGDTEGCDGSAGALRQEEHLVFKLATQYESPRVVFECNLHNEGHPLYGVFTNPSIPGRVFVATEVETDYRFNSTRLKLTEKA